MAAAHPYGAFVGCGIKRIGCARRIKGKFESDLMRLQEWHRDSCEVGWLVGWLVQFYEIMDPNSRIRHYYVQFH